MNEDLGDIINKFNLAQEKAVDILENEFECPRPESNMDFVARCAQSIRDKNYISGGFKIRLHGYGMEIDIGGTMIDFDFGKSGEINGFNPWRLYHFVKSNNIKTYLNSEKKIESAIESALSDGSILKSQGLNYYAN